MENLRMKPNHAKRIRSRNKAGWEDSLIAFEYYCLTLGQEFNIHKIYGISSCYPRLIAFNIIKEPGNA